MAPKSRKALKKLAKAAEASTGGAAAKAGGKAAGKAGKAAAKTAKADTKAAKAAGKAAKAADRAGKRTRTWLKRAKNVTDDDISYVVERGVDRAEDLLSSAQSWLVRLAKRIRILYDMLVAWWTGRFEFPKATVAAMTLALLYFINPFDLIPDVLPVIGLVDEAMVFAFVTKMMQDDVKRYSKKFGLKTSEIGL